MGDQLWKLFEETGDPCVYLLLKAQEREPECRTAGEPPQTQLPGILPA